MAKKKEAQEPAGKKQAGAGKKKADTEKLKAEVKKLLDSTPLDICYVFTERDNIETVAKLLTGHSRKAFALCEYSGVNLCDVKPGTVLRWPHGC